MLTMVHVHYLKCNTLCTQLKILRTFMFGYFLRGLVRFVSVRFYFFKFLVCFNRRVLLFRADNDIDVECTGWPRKHYPFLSLKIVTGR